MHDLWDRWLGVGLATMLAIATLVLTVTDRLSLYVNPSTSWFAVAMAFVGVAVGVVGVANASTPTTTDTTTRTAQQPSLTPLR